MPQRGIYSVTVPGWSAAGRRCTTKFGKLGFDKLLAPAIYYAETGFPVGRDHLAHWTSRDHETLAAHPNSRRRI